MSAMTPLRYIMTTLGIKAGDWSPLSAEDKMWFKEAAEAEMAAVGQEIKG